MPRPPKPPTVLGDKSRLDELKAMRHVLGKRVDDKSTSARDLSPLIRQLREISLEVEELDAVAAAAAEAVSDKTVADMPFYMKLI